MKKSLKRLSLHKDIVSSLADKATGGRFRKTDDPFTSTDPTAQTFCRHCPIED